MAYMHQELKQKLAVGIKAAVPKGWKYSLAVRNRSTLVLTIKSAPVDLLADVKWADVKWYEGRVQDHAQVNTYHMNGYFKDELLETFQAIHDAMNVGNHDRSDTMTDYFDVGWYSDIDIGKWDKPFKVTG